jgi:hypothetical protein
MPLYVLDTVAPLIALVSVGAMSLIGFKFWLDNKTARLTKSRGLVERWRMWAQEAPITIPNGADRVGEPAWPSARPNGPCADSDSHSRPGI